MDAVALPVDAQEAVETSVRTSRRVQAPAELRQVRPLEGALDTAASSTPESFRRFLHFFAR